MVRTPLGNHSPGSLCHLLNHRLIQFDHRPLHTWDNWEGRLEALRSTHDHFVQQIIAMGRIMVEWH